MSYRKHIRAGSHLNIVLLAILWPIALLMTILASRKLNRWDWAMCIGVLAVLSVAQARCESYQFIPQPVEPLPGVTQYSLFVCNPTDDRVVLSGGVAYREGAGQGIDGVTRSGLLRIADVSAGTSWERRLLMGSEIFLWALTGLTQMDVIEVREDVYKGLMPGGALSIRTLTTATKPNARPFAIPDDMIPPSFVVQPRDCNAYSFFGVSR